MKFTLLGEPQSKSSHAKSDVESPQLRIGPCYREVAGDRELDPGGFGVDMSFYVGARQRRDCDNFVKLVFDGLTGFAWLDDSQVTELSARIVHDSTEPRSEVRVYPTDDLPDRLSAICEHCDEPFRMYASWYGLRKYCGQDCRTKAINLRKQRICKQCGKNFQSENSLLERPFCSMDCKYESGRVHRVCAHCGRHITIPKSKNVARAGQNAYCDKNCQATYWRDQRTVAARGICASCGGPTSKKQYLRCNGCWLSNREVVNEV